ncbi:hypothetical protein [Streptomyces marokkonensis]
MATKPARSLRDAGQEWLLACTDQPTRVRRAWNADRLAPFDTGTHWRVVEAPLLMTLHAMRRIGSARLGPVLADAETDLAWWLVHSQLDDELDDIRQLTVRPAGWVLKCPPVLSLLGGRTWLERPDGTGRLTDPVLLGAAFGPGGTRLPTEVPA